MFSFLSLKNNRAIIGAVQIIADKGVYPNGAACSYWNANGLLKNLPLNLDNLCDITIQSIQLGMWDSNVECQNKLKIMYNKIIQNIAL